MRASSAHALTQVHCVLTAHLAVGDRLHDLLSCCDADMWCAARAQANSIVEAQLRENFEIGHPTPAYRALLQAAPVEFVGAPARLRALVEVLSAGVAATFAAQV